MRSLVASMALLALAAPALAADNSQPLTVVLDDNSPRLVWTPPAMHPANYTTNVVAWRVSVHNISDSNYQQWMPGSNDSSHWGTIGCSVSANFTGTSFRIEGPPPNVDGKTFSAGTATLTVDGQDVQCSAQSKTQTMVCATQNLSNGQHTAVLKVTSGAINIYKVTLTQPITTYADSAAAAPVETWKALPDGAANPNITWNDFVPKSDYEVVLGEDVGGTWQYPRMYAEKPQASLQFKVPEKTTYLRMHGTVDSDHGPFTVEIDPTPPTDPGFYQATAQNPWTIFYETLYEVPLDPTVQYNFKYTNLGQGTAEHNYADIDRFEFVKGATSSSNSSSSSSSSGGSKAPIGAIVGGVVGGVVALIALIILIVFLVKRRNRSDGTRSAFRGTIDDDEVYGPRPTPLAAPFPQPHVAQQPLLAPSMSSYPGGPTSVSGHTSTSGDGYDFSEVSSVTTAGFAGLGAHRDSSYGGNPAALRKAQVARQDGPSSHVYNQHADAGAVIHNPDPVAPAVVDVPPSYNPDWAGSEAGSSSRPTNEKSMRGPPQ